MQNVMNMLSAALVNFQGFGKLLAMNIHCFVVNFVAFCALFSVILWVQIDFIVMNREQ